MKKLILPVVIILIVAVFIANAIYGNKLAKRIDTELKASIAKNELPVDVNYSKVKVNPLFSKVKIIDISVVPKDGEGRFESDKLDINIPPKEALRLLESSEFEEIKSFQLKFAHPELVAEEAEMSVAFQKLIIDFDGLLTKTDFENMKTRFPDKSQELEFSFTDMEVGLQGKIYQVPPLSGILEQLTHIDAGSYKVIYNPELKELDLPRFFIKSPVMSYKGNATFTYTGDGWNDVKVKETKTRSTLKFEPKSFSWEDTKTGKGKFRLDKLFIKTNSIVSVGSKAFPQGEMELEIDNLKIESDNDAQKRGKSMIGLILNNLEIKELKFNYLLNESELSISDSRIRSSLLDADINASVDMNAANPANSEIREAKVTLQQIAPDLENLIKGFEQQMGKELPRENGAIVLELSGNLSKPKIKGFEF